MLGNRCPGFFGGRLAGAAIDDLDRANDEDSLRLVRIEVTVFGSERQLGLVDLDNAPQGATVGVDHGAAELLCQQPGGLIGDPELSPELKGRDAIGMGGHQMRGPEPFVQRHLRAVQDGARRD